VRPIRVLVVDDSVVARRIITDILQAAPEVEVAGVAASASIALQKISQIVPDIVLLDVEMPEMDGIEAVTRIRQSWPRLPVIMCSSLTARGADITLRAIAAGASDYVAKPSSLGAAGGTAAFGADLLAKIRALGGGGPSASCPPPPPRLPTVTRPRRESVSVIAIGSSTGGPNALATVFASLPRDLAVPILITQHMPPMFTRLLAERLSASSGVSVVEASEGELVEAGRAYIAPGNFHMTVVRDGTALRIALNQEPPENSCRPAVDVLFRSVARVFGAGALAAVLTGMGHDGSRGAQHIVELGGEVIVQDAASCVVASMPNSTAAAVSVGGVYPIEQIGHELVSRVARRMSFERGNQVNDLARST
jgi:two-component system, chemotaxis family, protein-glutamate methylesterase/glutaminase